MELNAFQKKFMKVLDFEKIYDQDRFIYMDSNNKDKGDITYYEKKGSYVLVIAKYKIPKNFQIDFNESFHHLRFGLIEAGVSEFQIKDNPVTNFKPAPYIAIEKNLIGTQRWYNNQQFSVVEVFIEYKYLEKLAIQYPPIKKILNLPENKALLYLPLELIDILKTFEKYNYEHRLTSMFLDAKILESLSILCHSLENDLEHTIDSWTSLNKLEIEYKQEGSLSISEINIIREIREIIIENIANPPTIKELSKAFYISEQKLNSTFKVIFHRTIGSYIKEIRLSKAANLLSTSELSIDEISKKVGYSHPSNFAKAFKNKFERTPLQYRKFNNR